MEKSSEYYDKNNICSLCEGKAEFRFFNDITKKEQIQPCSCDDGTRVGQLKTNLKIEKIRYDQLREDYKILQEWVKKTSKCKTCEGDQYRTLGRIPCKECGLPGMAPWPE